MIRPAVLALLPIAFLFGSVPAFAQTPAAPAFINDVPAKTYAYVIAAKPSFSLPIRAGSDSGAVNLVGARLLRGGRIVIADAATSVVTYYSRSGEIERVLDFKESRTRPPRLSGLQRVHGDSLAVLGGPIGWLLLPSGDTANSFTFKGGAGARAGRAFILAAFNDGSSLWTLVGPPPALPEGIWTDSLHTIFVPSTEPAKTFRTLPAHDFVSRGPAQAPQQLWFHPQIVLAALGDRLFYGFGSAYRITRSRPHTREDVLIQRDWTPRRISRQDFENFVAGWNLTWNRGPDSLEVNAEMLASRHADVVPAFSQFLVSVTGDLWVRSPNLIDAQGNGELDTVPLVPSSWSVFDESGRWITDVTLPGGFLPTDVGADYVLGVQYGLSVSLPLPRERSIVLFALARR